MKTPESFDDRSQPTFNKSPLPSLKTKKKRKRRRNKGKKFLDILVWQRAKVFNSTAGTPVPQT